MISIKINLYLQNFLSPQPIVLNITTFVFVAFAPRITWQYRDCVKNNPIYVFFICSTRGVLSSRVSLTQKGGNQFTKAFLLDIYSRVYTTDLELHKTLFTLAKRAVMTRGFCTLQSSYFRADLKIKENTQKNILFINKPLKSGCPRFANMSPKSKFFVCLP